MDCETYKDSLERLRTWYNSADKKGLLFAAWQGMCFSQKMQKIPDQREFGIFRNFVATFMSQQHQLNTDDHYDRPLRARLLNVVDLPLIQSSLRKLTPSMSQLLVNRVAKRLSTGKNKAGKSSARTAEETMDWSDAGDEGAHYTLNQGYMGNARRRIKPYGPPGNRFNQKRRIARAQGSQMAPI